MSEFLHMGGYAMYVWPSIGLGLLILIWNIILPVMMHRAALKKAGDYHAGNHHDVNGEQP
ncbi:MAG: heme exporter protein CcmD [Gammaproteobacteria bacterium]|nr:heme exporter protein CcmD [Gammaproteobacteria bacterium]